MGSPKRQNISLENVDYIVKFLKTSGHHVFSVLGGEPTLHPQFMEICDRALENGMMVRVFSNGLMKREIQKYIFRRNIRLILNVNAPEDTPKAHLKALNQVYENIGPNICPGYNIYKAEFDFSFIFELIEKHHMQREIRLGISQPIVDSDNAYVAPVQYRTIGKKLVKLARIADDRNIRLNFDCGFVLCMFNKVDVGHLIYANTDVRFVCGPTIDIDPELNVWACFPLSSIKNRNLREFADLKELVAYYDKVHSCYAQTGLLDRCGKCTFLKRKQCTGGCVSHKMKGLQGRQAIKVSLC